ncbi:MAG TPA: alpha/beta fold hydrolase [Opitutaceae bacterium]
MAQKRAFIIHGYQGFPDEAWQPWLKMELERLGFHAFLPAMPHPENPGVDEWIEFIDHLVGAPDEGTVLVGHSMGGFAVLLYLDGLGAVGKAVGKTVLIATGYPSGLSPASANERSGGDVAMRPWLTRSVDPIRVSKAAGRCTVILADDDPYIPIQETKTAFAKNLSPEIIVECGLGHMNEDSHITELPSALAAVIS